MVNGDLPFNINTHLLLPFAIVVALCLVVMVIFMVSREYNTCFIFCYPECSLTHFLVINEQNRYERFPGGLAGYVQTQTQDILNRRYTIIVHVK